MGLFSEIIAWKLRLFVPADAPGIPILAGVLDLFPVQSLDTREG